ncbi:MAG: hypothetical protein ACOYYU_01285 [Chloroflexota bacterium]
MNLAFKRLQPILDQAVSSLRVFNHPAARILFGGAVFAYIAAMSWSGPQVHLRTPGSFIFLVVALALILYPRDKASEFAGFAFILLLVFAPFYWRLQGFDTDGFTIGGVLPLSDANYYYTGALRILYGEKVSVFAARRPLFIAFLSVLIFVFGQNIILILMVLALLVSVAILFLMIEVKAGFGVFPSALLVGMLVYNYTGRFVGKFMTEQVGLVLGMLSLTLFLRGVRERKFTFFPVALLTLSFALNVRAGAFFVLPFLILWAALSAGKSIVSAIRLGLLNLVAVGGGFVVNFWLFKSVSRPDSLPFGNFGMTLYGLATGYRGWRSFLTDYPGVPESEAMRISLEILWNAPDVFFQSIIRAYLDYLDPVHFFSFLYLPQKHLALIAYPLAALLVVGLLRLLRDQHSLFSRMMFSVLAGIVLSVPFVPPIDDGIRAMGATNAFLFLLVALSLAGFGTMKVETLPPQVPARFRVNGLLLFTFAWLAVLSLGWLPVVGAWRPEALRTVCPPGESLVAVMSFPGTRVNIVKNNSALYSWLPDLRKEDWRENLANFPPAGAYLAFRQLDAGHSIFLGLNLTDVEHNQLIWLVAPKEAMQTSSSIENICALPTGVPEFDEANFLLERSLSGLFLSK